MGIAKKRMMEQDNNFESANKNEWIRNKVEWNGQNIESLSMDEYLKLEEEFKDEYYSLKGIPFVDTEDILFVEPIYSKKQFTGMKESGSIRCTKDYTIAHYESENDRLLKIAEKIKNFIDEYFILYDYKGNIKVNNKKVEKALESISIGGMISTDDGDSLNIFYDDSFLLEEKEELKAFDRRTLFEILYNKGYLTENLFVGFQLKNTSYFIDFVVMYKDKIIAIIEHKEHFTDEVKKQLLKYKEIILESQIVIPRLFFAKKEKKLKFYEIKDDKSIELNTFPLFEDLKKIRKSIEYKSEITSIASYSNDIPDKEDKDCLNIEKDVDAFAKLITYKKLPTPLSIGLFGKWGSGKSFFMKELESKIEKYTESNNEVFCKDVISVKFNAWHYSDTNLWASLVYKIFEEIDNKFNDNEDNFHSIYKELDTSKKEIKEKEKEKQEIENKINELNNELELTKEELEKDNEEIKTYELFDITKEILKDSEIRKDLKVVKNSIGLKNETFEEINFINNEMSSSLGLLRKSFKLFFVEKKYRKIFLYIILPLILIGFITYNYLLEYVETMLLSTIPIIMSVSVKFKELKPIKKHLDNILTSWNTVVEKVREKNHQEIKLKQLRISTVQNNLNDLENNLKDLKLKEENIKNQIKDIESGKYFKDFIRSKIDSSDYKKHLGLISLIRKDFYELEKFLLSQNKNKEYNIDRIVLYIDDLDRCSNALVVEVLEAIHLLLAFELFVVIVGIDSRWVKGSLESKHKNLSTNEVKISPKNYIEKIFQIPFNINTPTDISKKNLIKKLFNKDALIDSDTVAKEKKDRSDNNVLKKLVVGKLVLEETTTTVYTSIDYRELELKRDEIDYIEKVAIYLDDIPRTIKRFVNTYRVLRSHKDIQDVLEIDFYNYKTIVLLLVEVFWLEHTKDRSKVFKDELKDLKLDYERTFDNREEIVKLVNRFKFNI